MAKRTEQPVEPVPVEAAPQPMAETPKPILVKSGRLDGRIALWERNPLQPGGEVSVEGDGQPVQVAETSEVLARLSTGVLVRA